MYRRFLNKNDYKGLITETALSQMTRDDEENFINAEEAAEFSIIEYLTENYEIEKVLEEGKKILPYNRQITYPVGSYFLYDGYVRQALRTINGCKVPAASAYWEEVVVDDEESVPLYLQVGTYYPGNVVKFANACFKCLEPNGYDFGDIRVPGTNGWEEVSSSIWEANIEYGLWDVVQHEGKFYALIDLDGIDLTVNPLDSDNWGQIGEYDPDYNEYEFSPTEYVVYGGKVFAPVMNVNSDKIEQGYNMCDRDPRNKNVKKHMLRLAVYELTKMISPNNVSTARITDYENSIKWLEDASRLRINPMIPRKVDEKQQPETDYAIATFARDYDPNNNPWQI